MPFFSLRRLAVLARQRGRAPQRGTGACAEARQAGRRHERAAPLQPPAWPPPPAVRQRGAAPAGGGGRGAAAWGGEGAVAQRALRPGPRAGGGGPPGGRRRGAAGRWTRRRRGPPIQSGKCPPRSYGLLRCFSPPFFVHPPLFDSIRCWARLSPSHIHVLQPGFPSAFDFPKSNFPAGLLVLQPDLKHRYLFPPPHASGALMERIWLGSKDLIGKLPLSTFSSPAG